MATYQQRGKRWRAIVRMKGVTESKSFQTKAAAKEWARRIEHGADLGRVQEYRKPVAANTVAWMIDEYREAVGPIKPFGRTKLAVLEALKRDLGEIQLKDLDATRLNRYVADRAAAGAGGVTIRVDLSTLGTALRWLQAVRRIAVNAQAVQDARDAMRYSGMNTSGQERDRRPTPAELELLFKDWRGRNLQIPMQDIVEFAIATAMRLGEITGLQWADLDEKARTVLVRDRKDPQRKQGNNQLVPLLKANGYDALAIIKRQPKGAGRIFPYDPRSVSSAFTRAVRRCGIADLHFHDLRHEGTSRLFAAGYALPEVALCTGHKDWKMLARYTQIQAGSLHR